MRRYKMMTLASFCLCIATTSQAADHISARDLKWKKIDQAAERLFLKLDANGDNELDEQEQRAAAASIAKVIHGLVHENVIGGAVILPQIAQPTPADPAKMNLSEFQLDFRYEAAERDASLRSVRKNKRQVLLAQERAIDLNNFAVGAGPSPVGSTPMKKNRYQYDSRFDYGNGYSYYPYGRVVIPVNSLGLPVAHHQQNSTPASTAGHQHPAGHSPSASSSHNAGHHGK